MLFLKGPAELKNGSTGYYSAGGFQCEFFFDTNGRMHQSAEYSEEATPVIRDFDTPSYEVITERLENIREECDKA